MHTRNTFNQSALEKVIQKNIVKVLTSGWLHLLQDDYHVIQ